MPCGVRPSTTTMEAFAHWLYSSNDKRREAIYSLELIRKAIAFPVLASTGLRLRMVCASFHGSPLAHEAFVKMLCCT